MMSKTIPDNNSEMQCTMFSLPNEIISTILENNSLSCNDILNFSATCSQFSNFVKENQALWKLKLKQTLPIELHKIIVAFGDEDCLNELKSFFNLKKLMHTELLALSPKLYYHRDQAITFNDVQNCLKIATERRVHYFLSIWILSDIIKKGGINGDPSQGLYNLTETYYAKIMLRSLMHNYLMIKWAQDKTQNLLPSENVLNFFLQWIDSANIHLLEDINARIEALVKQTEDLLVASHPLKSTPSEDREMWAKGYLLNNMWSSAENRSVLAAVGQVVFKQKHMAVTAVANLDTLDIVKVLNTKCGSSVAVLSIFEAVARRCGVRCDLIAFTNHLFLEWRDNNPSADAFYVDYAGQLQRKRQCPYRSSSNRQTYREYDPYSFLQYVCSEYNNTMGAIQDWSTQNLYNLLDFLGSNHEVSYSYEYFLGYLMGVMSSDASILNTPINIKCLHQMHCELIWSLVLMHKSESPVPHKVLNRKRENNVRLAVGMVCHHLKYDYVCVVRGWEPACSASLEWQQRMRVGSLRLGATQPFYSVVAADYSERYVAQENLREIDRPNRLYHLEDIIAREFTHFDGFAYVPNAEKDAEYPIDKVIRNVFRNKLLPIAK